MSIELQGRNHSFRRARGTTELLPRDPDRRQASNRRGIREQLAMNGSQCTARAPRPLRGWHGLLKRGLLRSLSRIRQGELRLIDQEGEVCFGAVTPFCAVQAAITVHDSRFYADCARGGSIGAAEAYMLGRFSTDDLSAVIRVLAANREAMDGMDGGLPRFARGVWKLAHKLRRNTRAGSRANIRAHYDLSNDFFRLFLDQNMMYSAAIFERPEATLEEASLAKIERICQKLKLGPDDHLLEIGTGWGALAVHAAEHYGCRVTTTTISREQHAAACKRVQEHGLTDRVQVLLTDYRDLEGQYDKLVSVEMIEAVGHQYFDTFFARCSRLLHADGMMLLQAITIADQHYERAKRSVDFIQHFIFPGSCIPSHSVIATSVAWNTDLRIFHVEDLTPHYAETLRHWRQRFQNRLEDARQQGFSKEFLRMWDFYFCYCEGGFEERVIGDVQMLLTKPRCRREAILPPLSRQV